MENSDFQNDLDLRRPLGLTLLGGLYLFFFLLTVSSYGQPIPFLGSIYHGPSGSALVFLDSLICLYLFLGIMKRQRLTWYLLLGYNTFEVVNTLTNLLAISATDLEKAVGRSVDTSGLFTGNISVVIAVIALSGFIFRHHGYFTNRSKYLF